MIIRKIAHGLMYLGKKSRIAYLSVKKLLTTETQVLRSGEHQKIILPERRSAIWLIN